VQSLLVKAVYEKNLCLQKPIDTNEELTIFEAGKTHSLHWDLMG
jgi:hypothetical protein